VLVNTCASILVLMLNTRTVHVDVSVSHAAADVFVGVVARTLGAASAHRDLHMRNLCSRHGSCHWSARQFDMVPYSVETYAPRRVCNTVSRHTGVYGCCRRARFKLHSPGIGPAAGSCGNLQGKRKYTQLLQRLKIAPGSRARTVAVLAKTIGSLLCMCGAHVRTRALSDPG
jgi:hypothetical protein